MAWWQAIILGIVEGITEFLPVSSTGHLTIVEKLMGMNLNDASLTAFTAVIQIGAIAAAVVYFWSDIWTTSERGIAARRKTLNKSGQIRSARYDRCEIYQNER